MSARIPKQLQKEEFRFVLLGKNSKLPIEEDWQNTNNYRYDDPKLLNHLANGGNMTFLTKFYRRLKK